jgi:hypothetical protein
MAETDNILDPRIHNLDIDEGRCGGESSWSPSSGLLRGWDRPADLYDLNEEEQTEKQTKLPHLPHDRYRRVRMDGAIYSIFYTKH